MCGKRSTFVGKQVSGCWVLWRTCLASFVRNALMSRKYLKQPPEEDKSYVKIWAFHSWGPCPLIQGLAWRVILERVSWIAFLTARLARLCAQLLEQWESLLE